MRFPEHTLENWVSSLTILYVGIPTALFVGFKTQLALRVIGFILTAVSLTYVIKFLTRNMRVPFLKRPLQARDCNTWMNDGAVGGNPGFPSGHLATSAAFWTALYYLVPPAYSNYTAAIGVILTAAMMWSRMKKSCHTLLQVFAGSFVGWGVVYMGHRFALL